MYVYVGFLIFFQLITLLCICMYGLCPCACVAYDLINVMLLFVVVSSTHLIRFRFPQQPMVYLYSLFNVKSKSILKYMHNVSQFKCTHTYHGILHLYVLRRHFLQFIEYAQHITNQTFSKRKFKMST